MPFSPATPPPPIRSFCVQADRNTEAAFAAALLNPAAPVPTRVKGRAPRRYAVYRNNVTVGLIRAMEANFPAVRRLLGEAYFAGLAREFVQAHPPASPLLFHYGDAFAQFLAALHDLQRYPYLADVARLEQAWRRAYHAADASVLTAESLARLDHSAMASLRLAPHPAMALMRSRYAVHAIFTANRAGGEGVVDDPARAECVLVTRPRFEVEVRVVDAGAYAFIAALAGGATLAEAAGQGFDVSPSFDLADCIRLMVEAGSFQPLDTQDTP
jgi:hypothetical protein